MIKTLAFTLKKRNLLFCPYLALCPSPDPNRVPSAYEANAFPLYYGGFVEKVLLNKCYICTRAQCCKAGLLLCTRAQCCKAGLLLCTRRVSEGKPRRQSLLLSVGLRPTLSRSDCRRGLPSLTDVGRETASW